jgi:hypothetical protein
MQYEDGERWHWLNRMVEPQDNLGLHKRKWPSRVVVGFNRLGIVLSVPFLLTAAVLALFQWHNPTGRLATNMPAGAIGWYFGDDAEQAVKELAAEQRAAGFDLPAGLMFLGISLGVAKKDGVDWTKFRLPDGREIGIASTDKKKVDETARKFLVRERTAGRSFTDDDRIEVDGVRVAFLNPFDQFSPATSPWFTRQRDWTWTLICVFLGVGFYLAMRALGWVIDGFLGSRGEEQKGV